MTIDRNASVRSPFWVVPIVRAALAVVPALVITFSPDHTPAFGLVVFGVWALFSGAVVGALQLRAVAERPERTMLVASGVVSAVAGLLALAMTGAGLGFLLYLVSVWAAITGILEVLAGIRSRSRRTDGETSIPRDWIVVGVLTAVLALAFLLPVGSVVAVGLLGAYLVVLAVFLGIAGMSLFWERPRVDSPAHNEEAA